jgi:hypothetical protein
MSATSDRLGRAYVALTTIDLIRKEQDKDSIGKSFEYVILDEELKDLERATVINELEEKYPRLRVDGLSSGQGNSI